jgi:hypothetical protein
MAEQILGFDAELAARATANLAQTPHIRVVHGDGTRAPPGKPLDRGSRGSCPLRAGDAVDRPRSDSRCDIRRRAWRRGRNNGAPRRPGLRLPAPLR